MPIWLTVEVRLEWDIPQEGCGTLMVGAGCGGLPVAAAAAT